MAWNLLPLIVQAYIPLLSSFQIKHILKRLHKHTFSSIILDMSFYLQHVHLKSCIGSCSRTLLSTHPIISPFHMVSKHLFHQHIDIVLSTNGVNILTNVVITYPIWVNIVLKAIMGLLQWSCKGRILPWSIPKGYLSLWKYLATCTNKLLFLHRCDNITWSTRGTRGPPLLLLMASYKQKVVVAL